MKAESFNNLKNFSTGEKNAAGQRLYQVEDFDLIDFHLMQYVDELTSFIKKHYSNRCPVCFIHCITSGEHKADSQHYQGLAIDCHFTGMGLFEQVMIASLFPFTGIGFYPYSSSCFVHLDLKDLGTKSRRRLWYRGTDGVYVGVDDIEDVVNKLRVPKPCFENDSD